VSKTGLFMGLHAVIPDLSRFHVCGFQSAQLASRES
jgi:hypothetical protein